MFVSVDPLELDDIIDSPQDCNSGAPKKSNASKKYNDRGIK